MWWGLVAGATRGAGAMQAAVPHWDNRRLASCSFTVIDRGRGGVRFLTTGARMAEILRFPLQGLVPTRFLF